MPFSLRALTVLLLASAPALAQETRTSLSPEQIEARSLYGRAQDLFADAPLEALTLCEHAAAKDPRYRPPRMALGRHAFEAKDYETAGRWYFEALNLDPDNPTLLGVVAECRLQAGDPDEALSLLDLAEERELVTPAMHRQRVRALTAAKRHEEAKELLTRLREAAPTDRELLHLLLDVHERAEDWEAAIPVAYGLVRAAPTDRSIRYRYWRLLLAGRHLELAAKQMESTLESDPSDHGTRGTLVRLYDHALPKPSRKAFHETVLRQLRTERKERP